ncbi:MAG: hypothetical protein QG551_390 [Patescibacteria group bacterium]|jgi:hypothetical protein|nr:hypothetical protein [Patescibacteria group bacterium]
MRFQVPQFIDIQDKIFGPFTFKQFIYLLGGAGGAFVFYKVLPIYISIILIPIVVGLALALTFYKVNGRPFIDVLQSSVGYYTKKKIYIWKQRKAENKEQKTEEKKAEITDLSRIPKLTESKLSDISWSLDVLDLKERK